MIVTFDFFLLCRHPAANKLSDKVKVPLYPEKDVPIDITIKALVGRVGSSQYHVFEASRPLPRFSLYLPCGLLVPEPQGKVTFNMAERVDRVCVL